MAPDDVWRLTTAQQQQAQAAGADGEPPAAALAGKAWQHGDLTAGAGKAASDDDGAGARRPAIAQMQMVTAMAAMPASSSNK